MPKPNEPKRSNFPNGNNGNRAFRNAHKAWGKLKITNNNNNEEKRRRVFAVLTPHLPTKILAQLMTANKSVHNNVRNSPALQQKVQSEKKRLKTEMHHRLVDAFFRYRLSLIDWPRYLAIENEIRRTIGFRPRTNRSERFNTIPLNYNLMRELRS
jgi:hypothetical protein